MVACKSLRKSYNNNIKNYNKISIIKPSINALKKETIKVIRNIGPKKMKLNKLAFIGGSGIYNLDILNDVVEHDIISSFGTPSSKILEGKVNGNSIFFLTRHGDGHSLSPSQINYRANIDCLKQLGITDVLYLYLL